MLRYKTETRPGLVALYDIRPGNGAGQFLQPRSPHGALHSRMWDGSEFQVGAVTEKVRLASTVCVGATTSSGV